MKWTASEKIARVFEIVGYLWLTPSIISLFYPLIFLISSIFTGSAPGILFSAIPFVIFGFGVCFLVQYYCHSRGLLDANAILWLWVGTFVFNLLFLLPSLYGFYTIPEARGQHNSGQDIVIFVWGLLIFWWSMAVLLSITALASRFKNQK